MKKKIVCLAMVLTLGCMVGCGSDSGKEVSEVASTIEASETAVSEDTGFGSDFKKGCREDGEDIILTMQIGANLVSDLIYDYEGEELTAMHVNYYCADEKTADDMYNSLIDNESVVQDSISRDGNTISYTNTDSVCDSMRQWTRAEALELIQKRAKQMGYKD